MAREVDFEFIKQIWAKNKNEVCLYINSPYCASHCNYCIYWSSGKDSNYRDFYDRHLPEQVDKYLPILQKSKIRYAYFGGGTPNFEGLTNLIPVFERLKDLDIKERVIELHYGQRISDEDIELLIKYKFTTAIVCIQTFDKKILKRRNRIHLYDNDLDYIVGKLQAAGIFVGIDIMEFPGKEGKAIISDFKKIRQLKNLPDEITIDPLFQDRTNPEEMYNYITAAYRELDDVYTSYDITPTKIMYVVCMRILKRLTAVRMQKGEVFTFIGQQEQYQQGNDQAAVIGIGTYRKPYSVKKNVWSNCGRYVYHEEYDGKTLKYVIDKEKSFFDGAREVIDMIEKAAGDEEPPIGMELYIKNTTYTQSVLDNKDERLTFEIYGSDKSDFLDKVRESLPPLSMYTIYKDVQYKHDVDIYFDKDRDPEKLTHKAETMFEEKNDDLQ